MLALVLIAGLLGGSPVAADDAKSHAAATYATLEACIRDAASKGIAGVDEAYKTCQPQVDVAVDAAIAADGVPSGAGKDREAAAIHHMKLWKQDLVGHF